MWDVKSLVDGHMVHIVALSRGLGSGRMPTTMQGAFPGSGSGGKMPWGTPQSSLSSSGLMLSGPIHCGKVAVGEDEGEEDQRRSLL